MWVVKVAVGGQQGENHCFVFYGLSACFQCMTFSMYQSFSQQSPIASSLMRTSVAKTLWLCSADSYSVLPALVKFSLPLLDSARPFFFFLFPKIAVMVSSTSLTFKCSDKNGYMDSVEQFGYLHLIWLLFLAQTAKRKQTALTLKPLRSSCCPPFNLQSCTDSDSQHFNNYRATHGIRA